MWKKIRIDGVEVEFPEETIDDVTEILEKARRREKKKGDDKEWESKGEGKEDAALRELLDRIRRKLRRPGEGEEVTVLRKERELRPVEKRRKALEEREEKYGYKAGRNAHFTKPKEYADVPESQFADPVGFNYPVNTPKRARAALAYFMRFHDQYDDINAKLFIYERILRALKKFGIKRHFNPDFPGDWLMPEDLKEWMEGYDEHRDRDTEEMREKMMRRWGKKERRRLHKQADATSFAVVPSLGGQIITPEQFPSFSRELMENVSEQLENIYRKVIAEELEEFLRDFVEEMRGFTETIIDTFDTVVDAMKESTEDLVDATKEAAKEIRGALGIEPEEMPAAEEVPPEEGKPEKAPEGAPPAGEVPAEGVSPEEVLSEEVPPEEGKETKKVERLFKQVLTHDLLDEWSKWLTSPEPEEPVEEDGIVVDLEKGEFIGDLNSAETHVRFHDPKTGKVTRLLEVDEKEEEE
ncbi:MAG: hypothetical protein QW815_01870 [Nitrososphaerota archaeon]